ncbi:chemotaxis protein CheX [bacterium]|nr:chemotaxis protein CheX [bacterium]
MDLQYLNPFINSLINTFEMMLGMNPEPGEPSPKGEGMTQGDITGLVGFAEANIIGSVAVSFPTEAALKLYAAMTGEEVTEITRDVEDSIGEISNIVAGGAKTVFASQGLTFHISIPSVIVGRQHSITHKIETPVYVVPFKVDGIEFVMEISMKIVEA